MGNTALVVATLAALAGWAAAVVGWSVAWSATGTLELEERRQAADRGDGGA